VGEIPGQLPTYPLAVVRAFCRRFGGVPFQTRDRVIILTGPRQNSAAFVEGITKEQGSQDVIWLDPEPERGKRSSNLFEEYSLLKIPFSPTVVRP
jgi:hypothetical protein